MSWREDHVRQLAQQTLGSGPEWMGGKFGVLVRKVAVGIALAIVVVGFGHRLIYGPAKHSAAANSAGAEKPKGAF